MCTEFSSRRQKSDFLWLSVLFLFMITAEGDELQISVDHGLNWQPFTKPLAEPPLSALLRLFEGSPTVMVPECALKGSLLVQVWRHEERSKPISMKWTSKICHPSSSTQVDGIVVETVLPKIRKPEWLSYAHQKEPQQEQQQEQQQSFWSNYGLYVLLSVVFVLGQGIRKGLAELREEEEKERLEQRKKPVQVQVVVPKRKQSKVRRRALNSK